MKEGRSLSDIAAEIPDPLTAMSGEGFRGAGDVRRRSQENYAMMSLEYISSLQKDAARRSQKLGLEPFVITQEHKDAGGIRAIGKKIPNIGDRCPKGWRRVDPTTWYEGRATVHDAADALRRYLRHHLGFEGGNANA